MAGCARHRSGHPTAQKPQNPGRTSFKSTSPRSDPGTASAGISLALISAPRSRAEKNDKAIYKQRNIIERMFCRLKDWRRIATRFDRNLKTLMAAIALAAIVIWGYNESGP